MAPERLNIASIAYGKVAHERQGGDSVSRARTCLTELAGRSGGARPWRRCAHLPPAPLLQEAVPGDWIKRTFLLHSHQAC